MISSLNPLGPIIDQDWIRENKIPKITKGSTVSTAEAYTEDPLSYQNMLHILHRWRSAGGEGLDLTDTPGRFFFRILFHFNADDPDGGGLLHPTWLMEEDGTQWVSRGDGRADELNWWKYPSAYSYLMMNDEEDRARNLRKFIELLSDINTNSPWYFQSVKGLSDALSRKTTEEDILSFKDRGMISIDCLSDAVDQRIGTLLDLYRSFTWCWRTKRQILPVNLRKFDMSIVVIQSPIQTLHTPTKKPKLSDALGKVRKWIGPTEDTDYALARPAEGAYMTSYKVIELDGCEFSYAGGSSAYDSLENSEGKTLDYTINISFDDAHEIRFNEFISDLGEISDLFPTDQGHVHYSDSNNVDGSVTLPESVKGPSPEVALARLSRRKFTTSNQLLSTATKEGSQMMDRLVLGNMFGFSLERTGQWMSDLASGNVLGGIQKATRKNYQPKNGPITPKNIYISQDMGRNKNTIL